MKKGVLENFAKFTGKHRVAGFIKKEALAQAFSCELSKIFKDTIFTEHIRWLLLNVSDLE